MYYDYHVHSHFSSDCKVDMKDIIEMAIKLKLKEICFTDHIDYEYCDSSINFDFDIDEYTHYIETMRKKYCANIKILKGVEIGIQPHIIEKCDNLVEGNNFDFVIASIHTCNKQDLYTGDFYLNKTPRESYLKYFEELLYCIKNFKNFNVIGHLNILARYNNEVAKEKLTDYFDVLEVLFKALIERNKGIEVNTSNLRYSEELLLSNEVLKFYHDLGGKIITIGSDTHVPDTLSYKFDYVYDILKEIGFKYITTFEKMKPKFVKI
ncbi:histidinol-phosphatase HisJ family protein [Maledivibacter halophilus]|uniref:Histidinol-phosphatase n=1 Tax=Maledivibacter halophilus TaxID=36842 RepID=A0A1T5MAN2_9FIRM|nr:histidinol-phosphatase HisJ family protein [Maledivibacter halophilus]SKC84919.1 histidinol-phosphatase (PHP family) [Maledivibacter halophilus]